MSEILDSLQGWPELLEQWTMQGWLRPLDRAFAVFIGELDPSGSPLVPLAAALTSQRLGQGRICLDLTAAPADELTITEWPDEPKLLPLRLFPELTAEAWLQALRASPLVAVSEDEQTCPLVLAGHRLYLRRYWRYLRQVETALAVRLAKPASPPEQLTQALAELFPVCPDRSERWQRYACALAARGYVSLITGGPGTGKTSTVARLLVLLQRAALAAGQPLAIGLAAPTGKAAARLSAALLQSLRSLSLPPALRALLPTEALTLHRLLGSRPDGRPPRHDRNHPLALDLLVVDEASMIDLELMAQLLDAFPSTARLVLLGDKDQLASVEAGAVLGDLCRHAETGRYTLETRDWLQTVCGQAPDTPSLIEGEPGRYLLEQHVAMLRHSHRFGENSGIGQLARCVNAQDSASARLALQTFSEDLASLTIEVDSTAFGDFVVYGLPSGHSAYGHYLRLLQSTRPAAVTPPESTAWDDWGRHVLLAFDNFRLLCALRQGPQGVAALNQRIAQALQAEGLIKRSEGWYEGRPVLMTRNDYALGLMNGDVGIALMLPAPRAPTQRSLQVVFPRGDGTLKLVSPSRLHAVESVFAMTVHKSQGSEFTHAALLLPERANPGLTKEWLYTAITRSRHAFTLLEPASGVFQTVIAQRMQQDGGFDLARSAGAAL